MAKQGSVAPKERINIKYIPATGDQKTELELPHKLLVIGDFKGSSQDVLIENREAVSVNKNNFESILRESCLRFQASVPNRLGGEHNQGQELNVQLQLGSIGDFGPDSIAKQIPELRKLVELREALVALKGPLGNVPAFRTALQALIDDENYRGELLEELSSLGVGPDGAPDEDLE